MVQKISFLFIFCWIISLNFSMAQEDWSWATQMGDTTGHTAIYAMSPYKQNEFLISGGFGSRDFNFDNQKQPNNGLEDAFAAIIDVNGKQIWATSFGGNTEDRATAVASDKNGNIYIVGFFNSLTMTIGNTTLVNKGESDGFLVKVNQNKVFEWAVAFGNGITDEIIGVVTDSEGNIYVAGHGIDNNNLAYNMHVTKFDASKNIIWERNATTTGWNSVATSIAIDDADNIYFAGSFSDTLTFDADNKIRSRQRGEEPYLWYDVSGFLVKYSKDGQLLKAISVDELSKVNAITFSQNNIFLCGEMVNFGFGWGWPLLDSKIITSKLSTELETVWIKYAGGETPLQSLDIVNGISTDNNGNVYVTGYFFSEEIKFGNSTLKNIKNKEYFYQMAFVLKYGKNGEELWGKSMGGSHTDMGMNILALDNDRFLMTGNYESDNFKLGTHVMHNNGVLQETYVHLRPARFSRPTYSFVGLHNEFGTGNNMLTTTENIRLFPNPTKDVFIIRFDKNQTADREISIQTTEGKFVYKTTVSSSAQEARIDVGQYNKGIYLVKVKIGSHVAVQKLVKN